MGQRQWEIGICGTFDVENYGDLLFPLIAESELRERLGELTLHRFSYYPKTRPEWPFEVTPIAALPEMIHRLDGLLIGGGFLIRFDKVVAPGYMSPASEIHHPTGYWLTPALIALQNDVPLVWNAPGTDGQAIPPWANPLVEMALTLSRYVAVRDEPSRSTLQARTSEPVAVVPDTAFGVARLLNIEGPPSAGFVRLCGESGLDGPYIVIQANPGLEGFVRFVKNNSEQFRNFRFVTLPIGPVFGDRHELIDTELPGAVRLADWPSPFVIAELIGRAQAAVGQSYHFCLTALACGVPVFARHDLPACKYSVLEQAETYFELPPSGEPDIEWFLAHVGRSEPSAVVSATEEPLRGHWDRIAAELRAERVPTSPALNQFWQSLPGLLEDAAVREADVVAALSRERLETQERNQEALASGSGEAAEARQQLAETQEQLDAARYEAAERQARLDDTIRELTVARAETAARDSRIAEIMASLSWRMTAPLRSAGQRMRKPEGRRLMNLEYIRRHRLETDPYQWAAINGLFNSEDSASLTATYPCDHFKLVSEHGKARYYDYEARGLIGMGADGITYPDDLSEAWRALANDLLSPEYRAAMTALTGCDLTHAPMEVNVFHYGPGGSMDPHPDLPAKVVTHVLYFNRAWNGANGGCLRILRSANLADVAAEIPPVVGRSAVIVRSDNSWHAVSQVAGDSPLSRRAITVTFYRPGSVSTMWPPGDTTPLHRYHAPDLR